MWDASPSAARSHAVGMRAWETLTPGDRVAQGCDHAPVWGVEVRGAYDGVLPMGASGLRPSLAAVPDWTPPRTGGSVDRRDGRA